ncbi:hypothetical protein SAMN02910368_01326 [Lachnospiraceae bacterium G11]|nr:hypothetical protein SAMN02910368_01326 [Lachnospiraceae bacterium G11]
MVKKNLVNKNVVRALSIGLSLAMASQPMMAMAAEEKNPIDDPETWYPEFADFEAADFAQGVASVAWNGTEKADDSIEDLVDAAEELRGNISENVSAAVDELRPQVQETEEEDVVAEPIADADGIIVASDDDLQNLVAAPDADVKDETVATDECDRAEADIEAANQKLEVAEEADKEKVDSAKTAGEKAKAIVSEVSTANETISQAKETAASLVATATSPSSSQAAATQAVADLRVVVGQAEEAYNTAAQNVETLETQYETAKAELKTANQNYKEALTGAQADRQAAMDELDAAEVKLNAVKTALETAQEEFKNTNKNALAILAAWEDVEKVFENKKDVVIETTREGKEDTYVAKGWDYKNQSTDEWRAQDALFEAIFKNYAEDGSLLGEGVLAESVSRHQGVDNNVYNYFEVKYRDADGELQTKYFDFKQMAASGDDKKQIYIFEVSEDEVKAGDLVEAYLRKNRLNYANLNNQQKEDIRVYTYVENETTKYMLGADRARMLRDGSMVTTTDEKGNTLYWIKNHHTGAQTLVTETKASLKNVDEKTNTSQTVHIRSDKWSTPHIKTWRVNDAGVLENVETAMVQRTTYEKKSANSGDTYYDNARLAQQAMNKAISDLKELAEIAETEGDVEKVTLYRKAIEYIPVWTAQIDPRFNSERAFGWVIDGRDARKETAKKEYVDRLREELKKQGFDLDSYNLSLYCDSALQVAWESFDVSGSISAKKGQRTAYGDYAKSAEEAQDPTISVGEGFRPITNIEWGSPLKEEYWYIAPTGSSYETVRNYTDTAEKYTYAFYYLQQLGKKSERREEISVKEYEDAVRLLDEVIQNANQGTHLLETNNEAFQNFINAAKETRDNYANLLEKVKVAKRDVDTAQAEVDGLKVQIWLLQQKNDKVDTYRAGLAQLIVDYTRDHASENGGSGFVNMFELAGYDVDELENILDDIVNDAKNKLKELKQDVDNLNTQLSNASSSLNRFNTGGGGEGGGEPSGDEGTGAGAPAIGGAAPAPVLLGGAAPAGFIGGGGAPAAAGEGDETVELTNGQAALAATVPDETTEQPQLSNLQTPDAPLAAAPINEETLSWWWLLIIAVLGGAGYAMYKKFQTKKDEKTTN